MRILGVGFGIAVGVGNTIGTGIFRTPGEVASHLGSAPLFFSVWALGGAYALLCSNSVAELGTMLPEAGGWYVYSRRAFGERIAFVVGCCDWVVQSVATAYLAVAFGEFMGGFYPGLMAHVQEIGVAILVFLASLNWVGLRMGSRAQELTSLAKAAGLLAFVVACFVVSPKASITLPSLLSDSFPNKQNVFLGLVLALQGVVITYDGWYAPIYFVEEDRDPSRNLPRAMVGTVLSCIVIFLLVDAALFHILHLNGLLVSQNPAADAAMLIFGHYGKQAILFISLITAISTINAALLYTPRILFAMARNGLVPQRLSSVNRGGTPSLALWLCTIASILLVLNGTFDSLVAVASILFVAVYLSGFVSLIVLRNKEPTLSRPYQAWWYPWSTIVIIVASALFLIGSVIGDLKHSAFTVLLVLFSYAASRCIRVTQPQPGVNI